MKRVRGRFPQWPKIRWSLRRVDYGVVLLADTEYQRRHLSYAHVVTLDELQYLLLPTWTVWHRVKRDMRDQIQFYVGRMTSNNKETGT